MVWARGGSGGGFFWKNGLGGRVLEEDFLEKWSGGHFFSKKNLPKISAWGIFLEKFFLKFLKIFKNFKNFFSRKILEKCVLLLFCSKNRFSRIFLEKNFLKFLKIFKNFKKNFSRKIPQAEIFGRFFFRKKCPPDHFSRKSSSRTLPPRPFFQKNPPPDPPLAQTIFKRNPPSDPPPLPLPSPKGLEGWRNGRASGTFSRI